MVASRGDDAVQVNRDSARAVVGGVEQHVRPILTGPTYNGGCAWDHSAFLFVDGGKNNDRYEFDKSAGNGRADINSWGVFADLGGDDIYIGPAPGGRVSRNSVSVFFDAAGRDNYDEIRQAGDVKPEDGRTHVQPEGAVFVDH